MMPQGQRPDAAAVMRGSQTFNDPLPTLPRPGFERSSANGSALPCPWSTVNEWNSYTDPSSPNYTLFAIEESQVYRRWYFGWAAHDFDAGWTLTGRVVFLRDSNIVASLPWSIVTTGLGPAYTKGVPACSVRRRIAGDYDVSGIENNIGPDCVQWFWQQVDVGGTSWQYSIVAPGHNIICKADSARILLDQQAGTQSRGTCNIFLALHVRSSNAPFL
jgi:hypothetical protein